MTLRIRRLYAVIWLVLILAGLQVVYLLIQERSGQRLGARFAQLIEDRRELATPEFLRDELSQLAQLGLIRCYGISDSTRSEPMALSAECGRPALFLGASPVSLQVGGARGSYWTLRFEALNPEEFYVSLWILRGLVVAVALILARPLSGQIQGFSTRA